jgi:hypothetical protein
LILPAPFALAVVTAISTTFMAIDISCMVYLI